MKKSLDSDATSNSNEGSPEQPKLKHFALLLSDFLLQVKACPSTKTVLSAVYGIHLS